MSTDPKGQWADDVMTGRLPDETEEFARIRYLPDGQAFLEVSATLPREKAVEVFRLINDL